MQILYANHAHYLLLGLRLAHCRFGRAPTGSVGHGRLSAILPLILEAHGILELDGQVRVREDRSRLIVDVAVVALHGAHHVEHDCRLLVVCVLTIDRKVCWVLGERGRVSP